MQCSERLGSNDITGQAWHRYVCLGHARIEKCSNKLPRNDVGGVATFEEILCRGVLGIPSLENKKGLIKVWFFWFSVFCCRFLVSGCCSLVYRRYLLHNTKFPFRVVGRPCPWFWRFCYANLHHLSARVFSEFDKIAGFRNFEIYKIHIFKSINTGSPGVKKPEIMACGGFGPPHNETEILLDQTWWE